MLIRISQSSSGIEHYFETGKKAGREHHRDNLDKRVHLSGDLDAFSRATKYSRKHKDWKSHYWHITVSFAAENNQIDDLTLKAINEEMMAYYFCAHDTKNIIHAAEVHKPIIQSSLNRATGEHEQRLLHFHNAIAKYDPVTGNQIRMIPFNKKADKSFQSYLCEKYGLVDPATRKRDVAYSKRDIIAKWKGDPDTAKQTKVSDLRKLFAQLTRDAKTISEVRDIVMSTELATNVVFKNQKSGNKYLQVKVAGARNINLRGKGFEHLSELYYGTDSTLSRTNKPSDVDAHEAHKEWWLKEQAKRSPQKKYDPSPARKKYVNYYKTHSLEQRIYFVIYRSNIKEKMINGYKIFENNNERHLVNNDLGVKIFDKPNEVALRLPRDREARERAVQLALQIAIDKGWDLDKLNISGSFEFKKEVAKQIQSIKQANGLSNQLNSETSGVDLIPEKEGTLNAFDQAINDIADASHKKLTKDEISKLKSQLSAHRVLNYAVHKYALLDRHFVVTDDNKIKDTRTRAKPRNVIDFMTKTCNVKIADAIPELNQLYATQTAELRAESGIRIEDTKQPALQSAEAVRTPLENANDKNKNKNEKEKSEPAKRRASRRRESSELGM